MKCSAILLLALIGAAYAKRQVIVSPPPITPSPPPPPPPGASPAPAPVTFATPGFLWSVVIPGYTQASFGTTQQNQLCEDLIDRPVQDIAIEQCQISSIATYNGSNVEVSGYTFWGWTQVPNAFQLNVATALRNYAVTSLTDNATAIFAKNFPGTFPNCACDGVNEVTQSGNLPFVYKNLTSVPASVAGPAQCGARLNYDSTVASNVLNQVGIDSSAANFGKFCAPGGVVGGVVGVPGAGTCVQYGVIASASGTTQAAATSKASPGGTWGGATINTAGSGYASAPTVTIGAPAPVAITTPSIPLSATGEVGTPSFITPNGPYATAPAVTFSAGSAVCVSTGGSATCTGTSQTITAFGSGGQKTGPRCIDADLLSVWSSSTLSVTGFTLGGVAIQSGTGVFCTAAPTIIVSSATIQPSITATAIATISGGAVTAIITTNTGSGYVSGSTPTITIASPVTNDIGKLCSPSPITGLPTDLAVSSAQAITTSGTCQPLGYDTRTRQVCSVPSVVGGRSNWNKLGVQTCNVVSSFRAQPNSQTTSACLVLSQTFEASVLPPPPPSPAPKPAPSPAPKPAPSPAPKPAPSPAPKPAPPAPLVCSYRGIYEIIPLYAPCNRYRIASGTDSDCDYNLVTLRTAGQVGRGKIARLHWEFATIAEDNLSVPTNVLARARRGCTNRFLAAPSDPTTLKTGGSSWKWQFVPFPGSSKCDEVNVISQNRLSTTAFLQVPNTCDRFRYNATDGGRQRFRLRKITL
ncbi:hypothetical protein M9434_003396 [Picochlorum sp. BPE23]|nr:hypothetical protein M9434_003396 [Picochlorum sp. BPE23]